MSPADRIALIEQIAHELVWVEATQNARDVARDRAKRVVAGFEKTGERIHRLGWVLVDTTDPAPETEGAR